MKKLVDIQFNQQNQVLPQGVDLTDSFILGWKKSDSDFTIEMEFSLWPKSPFYSKPLKDEFTCYKKGILHFLEVDRILGYVDLESIAPNKDSDGTLDWGEINNLTRNNSVFKIETDFNEMEITCQRFEIEIK